MTTTTTRRYLFAPLIAALALVAACMNSSTSDAQPPPQNLWGTATPATPALSWDGKSVELGTRFTVTENATATGVRFFRGAGNDGTHKGYLYRGTTRVAEVVFANETPGGWQEALFPTPVALTPGTAYTVSYLAPKGHYSNDEFRAYPKVSGVIKATAGTYRYGTGGVYPSPNVTDETYYADVIVTVGAPTTTTTPAPPTTTQEPPPPTTTTAPPTSTVEPITTTPPAPTTTPPPPPPAAYPNADNTGPTGALTILNGDQEIRDPGTVIDGKDIRGCIVIKAADVTIRNSKVSCSSWAGIYNENQTGLLIEDTEVTCNRTGGSSAIGSVNFIARRVDIHDCENGFDVGFNVQIRDSWVHNLGAAGSDPHIDGIQAWDGSNVTVDHNTIEAFPNGTSALIYNNNPQGPITRNATISNNLLAGGAYTLYCPRVATENMRVIDNRFSTKFYPNVGAFGPITDCGDEVTSGNVYHETGASLPIS